MTYKEETFVLDTLKELKEEVHENNVMLKDIIKAINSFIQNHNNENQQDFFMNILANMISNNIDFNNKFNNK